MKRSTTDSTPQTKLDDKRTKTNSSGQPHTLPYNPSNLNSSTYVPFGTTATGHLSDDDEGSTFDTSPFTFFSTTTSPPPKPQRFTRETFENRVKTLAKWGERPAIVPLSGKIEDLEGATDKHFDAMAQASAEYVKFMMENSSWNKKEAQQTLYPLEKGVFDAYHTTMTALGREGELPPPRDVNYLSQPSPYGGTFGGGVQAIASINPGGPGTSGYEPVDQSTFTGLNSLYGGTFVRAHEHNKRLGGGGEGRQVTYMTFDENTRMDKEYEQQVKRLALENAVPVLWEATPIHDPGKVQSLGYDPRASQVIPTGMSFFAGIMQQQDGDWIEGNNVFQDEHSYNNKVMDLNVPQAQSVVRSVTHTEKGAQLAAEATSRSITDYMTVSPQLKMMSDSIRTMKQKGNEQFQQKKAQLPPKVAKRVKEAVALGENYDAALRYARHLEGKKGGEEEWQAYIARLKRQK